MDEVLETDLLGGVGGGSGGTSMPFTWVSVPASFEGTELDFFSAVSDTVPADLLVRDLVLPILPAADPDGTELAGAVATDPASLLALGAVAFPFSSSVKDGSFSGHDFKMFSWFHIRSCVRRMHCTDDWRQNGHK
jgi:hypothetical protein